MKLCIDDTLIWHLFFFSFYQLSSALQNLSSTEHVCEAILQSLSAPPNNATMTHLQSLLCSINQSSLLEAAMAGFLANHQFVKQVIYCETDFLGL